PPGNRAAAVSDLRGVGFEFFLEGGRRGGDVPAGRLGASAERAADSGKETAVEGRGAGRNRTDESRFCRPLPYHLATAPGVKNSPKGTAPSSPQREPALAAPPLIAA